MVREPSRGGGLKVKLESAWVFGTRGYGRMSKSNRGWDRSDMVKVRRVMMLNMLT